MTQWLSGRHGGRSVVDGVMVRREQLETSETEPVGLGRLDRRLELEDLWLGATIASPRMDQSLRDAAEQGNIDALYGLIRRDVKVLDRIDELSFVETPLHIVASAGHTRFALEIMRLKPSFSKKRNEDGFTPLHLALQNNQTEVVRQLLDVDENLDHVQGKEGVTPLHYVVQTGNLHLLVKFLYVCPKSIKDVTIRRDTAFHIALENN
ncbi:ankyrin repeat-containing protein BDA1-like [Corylus avellana]|uniref:ankyrin repeat-containing protein BDA1-like n=1 Tax=Corylus avellana TaxID=13451 RepID=UPI00286B41E8|nr:ankyrin repeat-containing protein BDA1-like [Corylus avellana]